MHGTALKIRSPEGAEFDCYLATPQVDRPTPAIVLGSAIHGVDDDVRGIADAFASRGFIAAAPDLFWRTLPGRLARDDPRAAQRAQPRMEKIRTGETDLADVRSMLGKQRMFNGRAAVMGFCYSGPYAIVGPKRLGYDAGIACHGTQMLEFVGELEGTAQPLRILWGDQDAMAPANVLEAYRAASARMNNLQVHVFPRVDHGYMMRGNTQAFDRKAHDFSMECAFAILELLRAAGAAP